MSYELMITQKEIDDFYSHKPIKQIKKYKYSTGTIITVEQNAKGKKLFIYDASFSESVYDTLISLIYTFDRRIFSLANGRSQRFNFVESHFK